MAAEKKSLATARVTPTAGDNLRCEQQLPVEFVEAMLRDLDGLAQLQQFQLRLLSQIRQSLLSVNQKI